MVKESLLHLNKSNVNSILKIGCGLIIFIYSLLVGQFATEGDQVHYREIYNQLGNLPFSEALVYYFFSIDSREVVHFFLSWIFSTSGVEKDFFIAISNAVLAYLSVAVFLKLNTSKIIIILIIFSSFYFNVLYFSAERLKYGFIFLMLSMLYANRKKTFYVLAAISVFSHVQMAINYSSFLFLIMMKYIKRVLLSGMLSKSIFVLIFILIVLSFLVGPHIINKFQSYYIEFQLFDFLKIFVVMSLTIFYSKNKWDAFFTFIPLIIITTLIGSDRVLMIGYFLFLYYGLQVNRGLNIGVILTTAYFSLKSIGYLYNLILFGNGFY